MAQLTGERLAEDGLHGHVLVVAEAFGCLAVETLLAVQQIGGAVPQVAVAVDVQHYAATKVHGALVAYFTYLYIAHSGILQNLLNAAAVLVAHLYHHAGILCKEDLHQCVRVCVFALELAQIELQAACGVGEAHFQQTGGHAACADVVSGQDEPLAHQLLHSQEGVAEVFGVLHRGHIAAHQTTTLVEGAATKPECIETEVDVVQAAAAPLAVHLLQYGRHYLADVAHFAACAHDYGARADNLVAVGVFLSHAQRVLARGYIDLQGATEVAKGLYCRVETCVLAFLGTARPHPVGTEADAVHCGGILVLVHSQWCPYQIGQCLGHGQHAACRRVCQGSLRSVSQGGGYALLSSVVQGYGTAVA